jgi:ABC-type sugar transport system substrate-binding protein
MAMTRLALLLFLGLLTQAALAFSVAFVNPGKSNEEYWVSATQAMQAAASNLGIDLEVVYAERDHLHMVDLTRALVSRPLGKRPDCLILVNERRMGTEMLKLADAAGVDVLFVFSGLSAEDRSETGEPRERYRHWLGSLEPHAEDAGYLTARALIEQGIRDHRVAVDGKLHMVAIAGDRSTPASIRRNEGMQKAIAEHPNVVLDQIVYGDWQRQKAADQAHVLFTRYPTSQLVWTGSDLMAFGAMDALRDLGGTPGHDKLFSAVNNSIAAMNDLIDGHLNALAGGHFMAGAWAVVMLYDYHHGHDFASERLELDKSMFTLFDQEEAHRYLTRFGKGVNGIDFKRFSKARNPALKQYDFRFGQLLK